VGYARRETTLIVVHQYQRRNTRENPIFEIVLNTILKAQFEETIVKQENGNLR